jgi:ankyrin repeat protein
LNAHQLGELLVHGADINYQDDYGRTALMYACLYDHPEVCTLLINNKAGIDMQNRSKNTALIIAAMNESVDCVRNLMLAGANSKMKGLTGETALEIAVKFHHDQSANILRMKLVRVPHGQHIQPMDPDSK